jgi:3-phenylpropionate/trans-cinnamate dioxygenase ferredoxin reductase component
VIQPRRVVIAGAGLAGARCAETLRARGFEGRIVLVGDEPVAPYERPALSKEFLLGTRAEDDLFLRPLAFWEEHRIELMLGRRVAELDVSAGTAVTSRGEALQWDELVLATGARPRLLPVAAPSGVHVLRTLADARALRDGLTAGARLVVVGGGFVGAEVASSARTLGVEVTMLEAASVPFAAALGREVGELLASRYRACGVDLRTETGAAGFRTRPDGSVGAVVLTNGTKICCDVALVAIGVEPAVELLPTIEHASVHACGDAGAGRGHWTSAAAEGVAVAHRILGLDEPAAPPPFFWSDQFGLRLQLVGDTRQSTGVEVDGTTDSFVARYRGGDGRVIAALAANRPHEIGPLRRELAFAA